jgi:hypothetical protein
LKAAQSSVYGLSRREGGASSGPRGGHAWFVPLDTEATEHAGCTSGTGGHILESIIGWKKQASSDPWLLRELGFVRGGRSGAPGGDELGVCKWDETSSELHPMPLSSPL